MLYTTAYQAYEVPVMLLAGMTMAAAGLFFRWVRHVICAGPALSLICDIMLGAVWAAVFLAGLTAANRGSLRLYHMFSAAAGAMLFQAAIGIPAVKLCRKGCEKAGKVCRLICESRPGKFLLR